MDGAFLAIHANKGIIETWPKGDSKVLIIAINLASTTPPVNDAVQL